MRHRLAVALLLASTFAVGCTPSDKSIIAQAADTHRQLEPAVMTDAQLAAYVQKVGDRIVKSARDLVQSGYKKDRVYAEDPSWMFDEVQFHLVNSETLNAFTTGGTHVYLYSELFETTKNENEFAAVVAHEFAHIVARHVAKGTSRQYGALGLAAAAAVGGYALGGDNKMETAAAAGGAGLVAGQFIGMGFTRKDESEADRFGFQFYCNAGYDPDQFGGFFQTLIDKGLDSSSALTSDHPLLKDRVQDAKKWAAEWKEKHPNWKSLQQPPIADASSFNKYQDRAVAIGKKTPNDKTLAAARLMLNAFPSCVAPTEQPQQSQARQALGAAPEDRKKTRKKKS